jgi:hypothetical protein
MLKHYAENRLLALPNLNPYTVYTTLKFLALQYIYDISRLRVKVEGLSSPIIIIIPYNLMEKRLGKPFERRLIGYHIWLLRFVEKQNSYSFGMVQQHPATLLTEIYWLISY